MGEPGLNGIAPIFPEIYGFCWYAFGGRFSNYGFCI